ncbi:tRNA splicing endonuclease subunit SEN2 [Sporobolomyces koalae]|uniref:tRNA splicing endonuclease subunit SEN2 n=1 Tax=Sporobolomyces koalae TaxID=500713 RepID=UPI00317D3C4D
MATPAPRNATRPENLASSNKRTSRQSLLALYSQLLPLAPPTSRSTYLASLLSAVPGLSLSTPQIEAVWDELTESIWVTHENDMQRLWRQGFFGKGFLSRSEPSWKRRVENRRAELEGREKRLTSEEITAQRRLERKGTKLVKKLERDAEKLLAASAAQTSLQRESSPAPEQNDSTPVTTSNLPDQEAREADQEEGEEENPPEPWQLEAEHTQLQPEEAFFLLFSLGCLSLRISSATSSRLSIKHAFSLFLESACPELSPSPTRPLLQDPRLNRLDSPFFLSYAVYHHYRSMGWVVRSGVKFCTDWVLYGPGGPVGGHAEFAVVIIPTYVNPKDAATSPFTTISNLAYSTDPELRHMVEQEQQAREELGAEHEHLKGEGERRNSWKWFHTVNRVCSGVKKTLVLLHVVIPDLQLTVPADEHDWLVNHPAQALAKLQMREVVVRRFLAGRMRD